MSLITAIKNAIFTRTTSDVTINERSFISVMLDSNNDESIKKEDLCLHLSEYKGTSLILTRIMIQCLVKFALLMIWIVYALYNLIHCCATGRWRGMKSSSGINLIIGSTVLIATIIALLYILSFLLKEVVLSPNNARINDKGVVTVDQPCLETHSFFLLNAATYWTSTDIQVSKKDRVFITASGSMYSDVDNMCNAAETNDTLLYPRSVFAPNFKTPKDESVKYCIYGRYLADRYMTDCQGRITNKSKKDEYYPRYGSLLYQISNNHQGPIPYNDDINKNVVKQMDFSNNEYSFTADNSGVLYLTFNDILLDRKLFNRIHIDRLLHDSIAINMCNNLQRSSICLVGDIKDQQIWFQDNLGEVLVNVRIEKNIWNSDLPFYKKIVVGAYRKINHMSTYGPIKSNTWIIVLVIMGWFIVDIIISSAFKKSNNKNDTISIKNE